jgi:hypothetical protein
MPSRKSKRPSLAEALLAGIVEPRAIMQRLLTLEEAPTHIAVIALLFISVCIGIPLIQAGYRGGTTLDYEFVYCAALTTIILNSAVKEDENGADAQKHEGF